MKENAMDSMVDNICEQLQRFSNAPIDFDIKSVDRRRLIAKLMEYEREVQCREKLYQAGEYELEVIQGKRFLFSIVDAVEVIPEALHLSEIEVLKRIAARLYNTEDIVINVSAFFRNPLGRGIQPHQDLTYEEKMGERILSLNIDLVGTSYMDGGLGYYNIEHGEVMKHRFCMRSGTWILVPEEIKAIAHMKVHDAGRAHLHTLYMCARARAVRATAARCFVSHAALMLVVVALCPLCARRFERCS